MKEELRTGKHRRITAYIVFGSVLLISVFFLFSILKHKSLHGIDQIKGLYLQPKESIDVLAMGSSHVHCGVNTAELWKNYGIAAYDYSAAEQPLWMSYYYLLEQYKTQNPQVILLDVYSPARFKDDYQYEWMSENVFGMRFSLNKLKMMMVSIEKERFFDYFPALASAHYRYDKIEENDFNYFFWNHQERTAFKGYTPYRDKIPQTKPVISNMNTDAGGLSAKSEEYLIKIIEETKRHDTQLILMVVPYIITEEDRKSYRQIQQIAEQYQVPFINFCEKSDEIGLDYTCDFNDESHLNYWGSTKFSSYLGKTISNYLTIPPKRREDPNYLSWNHNVDLIAEEIKEWP